MLRVSQWCSFGVDLGLVFADVRPAQDPKPLSVSRHHAVLDTVVDHFYEMAAPTGTTVQIAELSGAVEFFASRRPRNIAPPWCEPVEDWIEMLDRFRLAADHHAVASLQPPNATTRADIDIVNSPRFEFLRAPDIVDV